MQSWAWIGLNLFILCALALDIGVFHRKARTVTLRESAVWTIVWVSLAVIFGGGVWMFAGPQKGLEFFTGYLIEYSLSADNVFVFALVFGYFTVPSEYQHRVLFWGVLGALVMRAIMIILGAALIAKYSWIIYVFGAFLVLTGIKTLIQRSEGMQPEKMWIVRWFRRFVPMTSEYRGQSFFVRENGRRLATPLFLVLLIIEFSDLIFAVDSIPAIFAITTDPFIVYSSNAFAILGLRSLYFTLAGVMHRFRFLKTGLGVILIFIGIKMQLAHTAWKIDTLVALGAVGGILLVSVLASLLIPEKPKA